MSTIDLRKQKVIDLTKKRGIFGEKAQVVLALDISGSMEEEYRSGNVQNLLERIVPLALSFDDNATLDVFVFNDKGFEATPCTLKNLHGYVQREIMDKFSWGATSYAPVMKLIYGEGVEHLPKSVGVVEKISGLFSSFMGNKTDKKVINPEAKELAKYVIFVTDGDNSDHPQTENIVRHSSKDPIFWQFVGIGSCYFNFLEKLDNLSGRWIDNASFFKSRDIERMSDDDLYDKLLAEFPGWLLEMRKLGKID